MGNNSEKRILGMSRNEFMKKYGIAGVLLLMIIFMCIASPTFRTAGNVISILQQVSVNGVLALGMVFVITSGLSLFAATIGVALVSNVDMIKAIVILLARGALISMAVVIVLLPAMLMTFDKIICYTTVGMKKCAKQ